MCKVKHRRGKLCTEECSGVRACGPVSLLVEHLHGVRSGTRELKTKCCLQTNSWDWIANIDIAVDDHKYIKASRIVSLTLDER